MRLSNDSAGLPFSTSGAQTLQDDDQGTTLPWTVASFVMYQQRVVRGWLRNLSREVVQAVVADHVMVWLAEGVKGGGHFLQRCRRTLLGVEAINDVPCGPGYSNQQLTLLKLTLCRTAAWVAC